MLLNKILKTEKPTRIIPETTTDDWDLRLDFSFPEIDQLIQLVEALYVDDVQTSGKIVKGGWGTGKTHFRKYLETISQNKNSVFIESSMGRICNVYEDKNKKYCKLIYNHSNPSVRFLTAFFISAEENGFLDEKEIIGFENFGDPIVYVERYLESFLDKHDFITIFIDEMEELGDRNNANMVLQDLASLFHEEEMK
ncbi:MAG: hypothetical protein GF364_16030, partial [Candidatus Lokiarchaeota archaeon]|nr:hypothetical protein [Candidatus Lokiarchaeota archaeon]